MAPRYRHWLVAAVLFCVFLASLLVKNPLQSLYQASPFTISQLVSTTASPKDRPDIATVSNRSTILDPVPQNKTGRIKYNLTIVSAYFNLGKFRKGFGTYFSTDLYRRWAASLCRMHTPLVLYTDMPAFRKLMEDCRKDLSNITRIVTIENRTRLWSFQLRSRIKAIFDNPQYPKHHPNTVLPDYPCVQHAKYELVANTITAGIFPADHYAWLDIGYFRDIAKSKQDYFLTVPSGFNESRVAYTLVQNGSMTQTPESIFRGNVYWVGGGMFLGRSDILIKYVEQYKRAVQVFLDEQLMNSDQQVVYSMFTDIGRKKIQPQVELQLFTPRGNGNPWFYLGYLCLRKLEINETSIN